MRSPYTLFTPGVDFLRMEISQHTLRLCDLFLQCLPLRIRGNNKHLWHVSLAETMVVEFLIGIAVRDAPRHLYLITHGHSMALNYSIPSPQAVSVHTLDKPSG